MISPPTATPWLIEPLGAPPILDTETLPNGVRVMRCGRVRDAVRAPYPLGIRAYAYLRWRRAPLGDVLAARVKHVYFLVPPGDGLCREQSWPENVDRADESAGPQWDDVRVLGDGAIIVLPTGGGRMVRWLGSPGPRHVTPRGDVLEALSHAARRMASRRRSAEVAALAAADHPAATP